MIAASEEIPLRRILHASMLKHRPEATLIDAGNLATEIGRLFKAAGLAEEEGEGATTGSSPTSNGIRKGR